MKLGDSMAPIEACNVWNDVCPRKTRPPKIGDIPRHVAVDEESPGSSTTRSLVELPEIRKNSAKSMLERSTSCCHTEHGKPAAAVALPLLETFIKSTEAPKNLDKVSRIPDKLEFARNDSIEPSYNSNTSIPHDKTFNGPLPILDEMGKTSSGKRLLESFKENPCVQVFESISGADTKIYEEAIDDGLFEVRKDSALYLDEKNLDVLRLRDSLPIQRNAEEGGTSRLYGPRTRRESSGYFSNLGTFDEDRWSPMDYSNQQDTTSVTTRESHRERRRSSTKNRLPTNHQQPQIAAHVASVLGSGQQVNRITHDCPTNDETTLSLSENDAPSVITKDGWNEMPNINEQSSLGINKSSHFNARNAETDLAEIDVDFTNKLSFQASPLKSQILTSRMNNSSVVEKIDENQTSNDIVSETNETRKQISNADSTNQWFSSPRTTNRQRRRMVHQYSSPNMTNMELERIVEKPHSETLMRSGAESQTDDGTKNVEILDKFVSDEEPEDDDELVVVAKHEVARGNCEEGNTDERKLLPRSIKVYQLLSTQSEDRGDGDGRLFDRRISLQMPRSNEEEAMRGNACAPVPTNFTPLCSEYVEEKKLIHADSVPIIKIPSLVASTAEDELRVCANERLPGTDAPTGPAIASIRPIYPYCPYSPYASPQGSPRTNRRRPLRESRRVSIDSRQGALQLNQYKLLNNIGQGSYGIVKLAYNEEDETHYAMKILSKKKLMKKAGIFGRIAPGRKGASNPLAKVYREIALLKKLDHPNVVKLVEVLDDPDEDNLYLVFELVQKGEVLQLPTDKPLDEETARRHFRDVVMGVEYLHYQRIVHRDIKPSNLLVDSDGRVKVADLGVSAELRASGELLTGSAGTPAFAAPETTTPGAQYSGTLCDVWSMGVTLYSLVTGKVPWDGAGSIIGVQAAVRSEPLRFPEKPQLSDNLRDLISRMLAKDPTKRMTLSEIKEHCWLTKDGQEPLPNEADNCRLPVTVTDEEVARVVTRVPKLDTLILIKTMLKQHSFQNPFLPRRIVRTGCTSSETGKSGASLKQQASTDITDSSTNSLPTGEETLKRKTEMFHKAGRSNSAPDSYEWQTNGRQISSDSLLPPVTESSSQETEGESR